MSALPDAPSQAREALADAFDELAILGAAANAHEACELAAYVVARLVPARRIDVALYDIDADALRFVGRGGKEATSARPPLVLDGPGLVAARAHRVGSVVAVLADDPDFVPDLDAPGVADARTTLIAAAGARGRLRVVLQIVDPLRTDAFTPGDRAVSDYVARQLAETVAR